MRLSEKQIRTMCLRSLIGAVLGLLLGILFHSEIAAWMGWGYHPPAPLTTEKVVVPMPKSEI